MKLRPDLLLAALALAACSRLHDERSDAAAAPDAPRAQAPSSADRPGVDTAQHDPAGDQDAFDPAALPWMRSCQDSSYCGGLECVCGVCVAPCWDKKACRVPGRNTRCVPTGDVALEALCGYGGSSADALCLEPCTHGCGAGQRCVAGSCVPTRPHGDEGPGCTRNGQRYPVWTQGVPGPTGCEDCECAEHGVASYCTRRSDCTPAASDSCLVHGVQYAIGDEVPDRDGCNMCICTVDGLDLCTHRDCTRAPPGGCDVDGEHHGMDVIFPAADGCNTCTCTANGGHECTSSGCVTRGQGICEVNGLLYPFNALEFARDGCNTCRCQNDGSFHCSNNPCNTPRDDCRLNGVYYDYNGPTMRGPCEQCYCGRVGVNCRGVCRGG